MSVRKYIANKDTTITNAFGEVFDNRLTGSNAGLADSIEVFSLFGQFTSSAAGNEKSRALLQFPIINIQSDIDNSVIESGSNYILRLFSAETPETPPTNWSLRPYQVRGMRVTDLSCPVKTIQDLPIGMNQNPAQHGILPVEITILLHSIPPLL